VKFYRARRDCRNESRGDRGDQRPALVDSVGIHRGTFQRRGRGRGRKGRRGYLQRLSLDAIEKFAAPRSEGRRGLSRLERSDQGLLDRSDGGEETEEDS